jgi:cytochrome d ubiquinol oxidase subunit II
VVSSAIALLYIANIAIYMFPNFAISTISTEFSLNAYNAASSQKTLETMLIIAGIGVPIVLAYTIFVYRIFKGKVRIDSEGY